MRTSLFPVIHRKLQENESMMKKKKTVTKERYFAPQNEKQDVNTLRNIAPVYKENKSNLPSDRLLCNCLCRQFFSLTSQSINMVSVCLDCKLPLLS